MANLEAGYLHGFTRTKIAVFVITGSICLYTVLFLGLNSYQPPVQVQKTSDEIKRSGESIDQSMIKQIKHVVQFRSDRESQKKFNVLPRVEGIAKEKPQEKFNVLLLGADDMRAELGPFIHTNPAYNQKIFTPNIDKLAKNSMLFKHTYSQFPLCGPSRVSMMTSRRPDTTGVITNEKWTDKKFDLKFTTMPQYFRDNGYTTVGMGKVFHPRPGEMFIGTYPDCWSEPFHFVNRSYWWDQRFKTSWAAISEEDRSTNPLPDEVTTRNAVIKLRELASGGADKRFFLAVGLYKPHTPLFFPEEFLKHYPMDSIKLAARKPTTSQSSFADTTQNREVNIHKSTAEKASKDLRRAYYSAISYVDSLYGEILDELQNLGLDKTTIVVLWADHGYHLGDNGFWGKWRTYELSLHVPLIVRIPGLTDEGKETNQITEMVDIFPTVVEAAGLPPLPICPQNSSEIPVCREGSSLLPLIKDPSAKWKTAAFSRSLHNYTMRTSRYRYTEPAMYKGAFCVELYDHDLDPLETTNCAELEEYKEVVADLKERLHRGWRHDLPENQAL